MSNCFPGRKAKQKDLRHMNYLRSFLFLRYFSGEFLCRIVRGSTKNVIILFKTASLSHDFVRPSSSKLFLKKGSKKRFSPQNRAQNQTQNKKRARGNEFPRTLLNVKIQGRCACFVGDKLKKPYFAIEATSAAKSSCFFSMPSPFSKRTHLTSLISPPSSLATAAMCCSTETLFSLTKACCRRQFSS